jgi:hypothetical protein
VQAPAPDGLYVPAGQRSAVGLVEPAGHAYPPLQAPSHVGDAKPATDPKRPAGHSPLQLDDDRPATEPNRPALQLLQTPAPGRLNVPGGQTEALGDEVPDGQKNPAAHGPLQLAVARPSVPPYRPALQLLHDPDPDTLYVPTPHTAAVADTDPGTQ